MELILLEKVKNLGNLGDKVKVKAGYGRNFLIPQQKAVPATKANLAAFEAKRAELEKAQADQLANAKQRAQQLNSLSVVIARRTAGEGKLFGSVNAHDIAEAVTQAGVALSRGEVRLPTGALRLVGEYAVTAHLHTDVEATVTVHVVAEE
jgi:large subunit ribosomal protein L9